MGLSLYLKRVRYRRTTSHKVILQMKKSDKKAENAIRVALTEVCEVALKEVVGFKWLTHIVNYNDYPKSLKVICVFDTNRNLSSLYATNKDVFFRHHVQEKLSAICVHLHDAQWQVKFDTEEACKNDNNGNWQKRFQQ